MYKILPMEEKEINAEESLKIIHHMIQKTKEHYSDNSFYFILWGWLTFIAALGHYLLLPFYGAASSLVWTLMPLGAIISILYGRKQSQGQNVKTQLEEHIAYLWTSLGLALLVIVISTVLLKSNSLMPVFILLYAIGTFTTGCFIQFKPLVYGGLMCFILSAIAFFVGAREQLLLVALAILISYLIPGHSLKSRYNKLKHEGA